MGKLGRQARLEGFRRRLEEERDQLRGEISSELLALDADSYSELASEVRDAGDASVADLLVDLGHAVIDRHLEEMGHIEAAIARVDDDTFGYCLDCGEPIPEARLEAYPSAARCIDCQSRFEQARGATRPPRL